MSLVEIECGSLPKRLKKVRNASDANHSHNACNPRSQGYSSESLLNSQSSNTKPGSLDCFITCDNSYNPEESVNDKNWPLYQFRPGYLWVSDLTRQHWCEQQLHYSLTVPGLVEEKPVMTQGTNLHLERELAVHDIVDVKVTSNEDIWTIKVLNMINAIAGFMNGGSIAREVPIFGAPFEKDVFIVGLIDELRFDPKEFSIELWELKTRMRKSLPSKAQCSQHQLQIMLYKKMFDDMVKGLLKKDTIAKHLCLDFQKEFGEDIQSHASRLFLSSTNLEELMEDLFTRMQCLTCIQSIGVEYVHQDTKETIGMKREVYNETELQRLYNHYLGFWCGDRKAVGVEIEDAWKCQSCDYADICEWRRLKAEECVQKNSKT
ncbi:exonuclease V-like isoform X2 [Dreissena polymorpha]|nr:exonuclease V-like isoform X2 [Dreissena polymorpha]XP_052229754.1 exonuclease V-like isoform X2 [Dreissena polymorpha]